MNLGTVLRKELAWSRHQVVALLLILVLLPAAFAYGATFFQHVLPTDAPVAVVGGENVTAGDREVATAALGLFSKPIAYESRAQAFDALERETVYAVVDVPPGLSDRNVSRVNMTVTIDGDMVPYREPSGALTTVVSRSLNGNLDKRVDVRHETLGEERRLPAYLLPTFLFILVATFAFAYLPYNLAAEEPALDRLRVETSLEAVVGGKLLFFAAVLGVPIAVFQAAAFGFGYDALVVAPGAIVAYLTTFLACGAVAAAITLATRFSTTGRLLNVLVLFGVLAFSGVVYPAGFFSPLRREVIRRVPTHYAVVLARGTALKGHGIDEYALWVAGLVALVVVALVPLKLAIEEYERHA